MSNLASSDRASVEAFSSPSWRVYADTANYGLPPRATIRALEKSLRSWEEGSANWMTDWDPCGDACRTLVAPFLGALTSEVSLLPAVSVGAGLVAGNLAHTDEVLIPDDEFRSILFPMLAASAARGVKIRRVPFECLAEEVTPATTLIVTSHVRSNGGDVQDLRAVSEAAKSHGARMLIDATHSAGVLPIEASTLGLDYVLVAAYKHLLCPRGVAFMRTDPSRWEDLAPFYASWRSTREPYTRFYGGSLKELSSDASRFDVSLAWHPWVGAQESLKFLASVDASRLRDHTIGLASQLARALGLRPTGSSIVGIPMKERLQEAKTLLRDASVAASFPAGQIRLSFHLYNDKTDVDYIASILSPLIYGNHKW